MDELKHGAFAGPEHERQYARKVIDGSWALKSRPEPEARPNAEALAAVIEAWDALGCDSYWNKPAAQRFAWKMAALAQAAGSGEVPAPASPPADPEALAAVEWVVEFMDVALAISTIHRPQQLSSTALLSHTWLTAMLPSPPPGAPPSTARGLRASQPRRRSKEGSDVNTVPREYALTTDIAWAVKPTSLWATDAPALQSYGGWDGDGFMGNLAIAGPQNAPPPGHSYALLNLDALSPANDPTGENLVAYLKAGLEAAGLPKVGARVMWYAATATLVAYEYRQSPFGEEGEVELWGKFKVDDSLLPSGDGHAWTVAREFPGIVTVLPNDEERDS
jgi:hypothetical protein